MIIEKEKITIDDFSVLLTYEDALKIIAHRKEEQDPQKSYVEEKRKLDDRYNEKIQSLLSVRNNLGVYQRVITNKTKLENLQFRLEKIGMNPKKCRKSIVKNEKHKESLKKDIIEAVQKTNNLPVLSSYKKSGNDYKLQETFGEYILYIDAKTIKDFCGQLFQNINRDNRGITERFEYFQRLSKYATERNLTVKEAKESFDKEELNKKIAENNPHNIVEIEVINELFKSRPPEEVLSNYSKEQVDIFKKNMQSVKKSLTIYESSFMEEAKLKEQQKEIESTLKYLDELDNSAMDIKTKAKLGKNLQKELIKKTKKIEKAEEKLNAIKEKGNLNKYFDNYSYYENIVKIQKALGKEGTVSPEQLEEWKKKNEEYWNGEILEANAKKNKQKQIALPVSTESIDRRKEFLKELDQRDNLNQKPLEKEELQGKQETIQREETERD